MRIFLVLSKVAFSIISGVSFLFGCDYGFLKYVYGSAPCDRSKKALGLLIQIMCMVLLGFSFRFGSRVQPLSYLQVVCDFFFQKVLLGSCFVVLNWHCKGAF